MNRLHIFFAAVLAVMPLASCSDLGKGEPEKDLQSCADVWFVPGQAGSVTLTARDKKEVEIFARRNNIKGEIVVPVEIKCEDKGAFFAEALHFEDGQSESSFLLSFPDAEVQKVYSCNISIIDRRYALIYGLNETSVDLDIRIEDNVNFAKATFRSEVFTNEWSVMIDYSPILDEYRFKNVYDESGSNHISFKWDGKNSETVTMVETSVNTNMKSGNDYIYVTYESSRYNKMLNRFEFSSVYTVAGKVLAEGKEYYTITEEY